MIPLPFFFAGYLFRRRNEWMTFLKRPSTILLMTVVEGAIKYTVWKNSLLLTCHPIHVSSFILLLIDGIIGSLLIIGICHWLPRLKWLEWTGVHSLIYYFICGGVPLLVTRFLTSCGWPYQGNYLMTIIAFLIVYALSSLLTFIILMILKNKMKK